MHLKCIWKPAQHVKDILEGVAESSKLSSGVQLPTQPQVNEDIPVAEPGTVLEGEGLSDWMMVGEEYVMVADISDIKALEPQNLGGLYTPPPILEGFWLEFQTPTRISGIWFLFVGCNCPYAELFQVN